METETMSAESCSMKDKQKRKGRKEKYVPIIFNLHTPQCKIDISVVLFVFGYFLKGDARNDVPDYALGVAIPIFAVIFFPSSQTSNRTLRCIQTSHIGNVGNFIHI